MFTALNFANAENKDTEAKKDATSYCCDSCPTNEKGNYCEKLNGKECQKYSCLLECPCGSTNIDANRIKCNPC